MDYIEDTKKIETPSGIKLIIRQYLTGEDRRANRRLVMRLADEGKGASVDGLEEAENEQIKIVVKEIDGSAENIVERVIKMRADDYDFVMETVQAVVNGTFILDKKKEVTSGGSTETSLEAGK